MFNTDTITKNPNIPPVWQDAFHSLIAKTGKRKGMFKKSAPNNHMLKAAFYMLSNNASLIRSQSFHPLPEFPSAGYGIASMIMGDFMSIPDYEKVDMEIQKAMIAYVKGTWK